MSAELWILFGTFVAGAGATAVSWVAAIRAGQNQKDAEAARDRALQLSEDANRDLNRLVKAQEEQYELAKELARPPHWRFVGALNPPIHEFVNTSGRDMEILNVTALPEGSEGEVKLHFQHDALPFELLHGAPLRIYYQGMGMPKAFQVRWKFADSAEEYCNKFPISY